MITQGATLLSELTLRLLGAPNSLGFLLDRILEKAFVGSSQQIRNSVMRHAEERN